MQERQGSADHPRSDDVRGRPDDEGYEAGFGDGGRDGIGDQGIGDTAHRANPDEEAEAPPGPNPA